MAVKPLFARKGGGEADDNTRCKLWGIRAVRGCLVRRLTASYFLTSCIAGTSSGMSMRITVPSLSRLWMWS